MIETKDDRRAPRPAETGKAEPSRAELQKRAAETRAKARATARRGFGHHLKWILINIAWIIAVAWLYAHFLVPRLTAYLDRAP